MCFSLIICTYNGSRTIVRCLESLLLQQTTLNYEIIVVDNNSSDGTSDIVKKWANQNGIDVKLINEIKPGKVHALQSGILLSSGDYIVIVDDDNFLEPDYLINTFIFMTSNPQAGAICGQNFEVSDTEIPHWFEQNKILFGCGQLRPMTGVINNLWGAGMVVVGELIRNLYSSGLSHVLGTTYTDNNRFTSLRLAGEDNELCFWIKTLGYDLYYVSELRLTHFMHPERLTESYLENLMKGILISNKVFKYHYGIINKALKPIRKRDFVNLFKIGIDGKASRLKLGVKRNGKTYVNFKVLKKIKDEEHTDYSIVV